MTDFHTLLRDLVATPSLSGLEDAAGQVVSEFLQKRGVATRLIGKNLVAESGHEGQTLLLVSHLDTVPPNEGWTQDPWQAEWIEGKLTGLGANDAKGPAVAMVAALVSHTIGRWPGRVILVLAAEEEIGGPQGVSLALPQLGRIDGAVVGEPTSGEVCIAQRGMLILKCLAKGVSGHVAHPDVTENAIHKAGRDIAVLQDMVFEPDPLLGRTSAQVTTIQGGIKRNQVPDSCEFMVDFRTTPASPAAEITARVKGALESEVEVFSDRYLAKGISASHPLAQLALRAAGRTKGIGSATVSDWCFLGELPAVKLGPGDTKRSHAPQEFLLASELADGIATYETIVRGFAEGALR